MRPAEMNSALLDQWARLQAAHRAFHSPFLTPDFTMLVASVRDDVEVGVIRHGGEAVGFFPFQRTRRNAGVPVGSRLNDLQAVVCDPRMEWDAVELVRACGLRSWRFHMLLAEQRPFGPHCDQVVDAVFMDLSRGFGHYEAQRRATGSQKLRKVAKQRRAIERECGAVTFELDHSVECVRMLIEWKSDQYRRTGEADVFSHSWTGRLLERIAACESPTLKPLIRVLRVNGDIAAIEYAIQYADVLHDWFPVYNPRFAKYSPGLILIREFALQCGRFGVARIEMGKGDLPYKSSFASGRFRVAAGIVATTPLGRAARASVRAARRITALPGLRTVRSTIGRWTRPVRGRLALK